MNNDRDARRHAADHHLMACAPHAGWYESARLDLLRYRWRFRWLPRLIRWTVCAVRGHHLGQIEMIYFNGWPFHRPCKRCRVEVGCRYESMRGIYEYEQGYRHDGRYGLDMLMDEAVEAQAEAEEGK